ncbi:MAG: hypothetical protein WD991_01890 [Candidatus Paceibacterota bacterium]
MEEENPFLVRFLLQNGIVKEVRQADILLIYIVVFLIVVGAVIFLSSSGTRDIKLSEEENNFLNSPGGKRAPYEYDQNLFPAY